MGCVISNRVVDQERTAAVETSPEARVLRGQAYLMQGKLDEAMKELNYVIKTWPNCARAYLERGNVRYQLQDWEACEQDFTSAIAYQGDYVPAYMMRAQMYMKNSQFEKALADCRMASVLDPGNGHVRSLRHGIQTARLGKLPSISSHAGTEEPDPFAGLDTPQGPPVPKQCMVCMDKERGCRLRPCCHAALCVDCGMLMRDRGYGCPICGALIEHVEVGQFMRTFAIEDVAGLPIVSASSPSSFSGKNTSTRARYAPMEPTVEEQEDEHEHVHERRVSTVILDAPPFRTRYLDSPTTATDPIALTPQQGPANEARGPTTTAHGRRVSDPAAPNLMHSQSRASSGSQNRTLGSHSRSLSCSSSTMLVDLAYANIPSEMGPEAAQGRRVGAWGMEEPRGAIASVPRQRSVTRARPNSGSALAMSSFTEGRDAPEASIPSARILGVDIPGHVVANSEDGSTLWITPNNSLPPRPPASSSRPSASTKAPSGGSASSVLPPQPAKSILERTSLPEVSRPGQLLPNFSGSKATFDRPSSSSLASTRSRSRQVSQITENQDLSTKSGPPGVSYNSSEQSSRTPQVSSSVAGTSHTSSTAADPIAKSSSSIQPPSNPGLTRLDDISTMEASLFAYISESRASKQLSTGQTSSESRGPDKPLLSSSSPQTSDNCEHMQTSISIQQRSQKNMSEPSTSTSRSAVVPSLPSFLPSSVDGSNLAAASLFTHPNERKHSPRLAGEHVRGTAPVVDFPPLPSSLPGNTVGSPRGEKREANAQAARTLSGTLSRGLSPRANAQDGSSSSASIDAAVLRSAELKTEDSATAGVRQGSSGHPLPMHSTSGAGHAPDEPAIADPIIQVPLMEGGLSALNPSMGGVSMEESMLRQSWKYNNPLSASDLSMEMANIPWTTSQG